MAQLEGIHIQRTQKQHSSVVVVIPIAVRKALGIVKGDFIIFASHRNNGVVEISKFHPKEVSIDGNKINPDRKAEDGTQCIKDGGPR